MKNRSLISSSLLVLALMILVSASAQAQAYNPIRIAGPVTAFTPADCGKPGSITIANVTIPIAAGAEVSFIDSMQVIASNGGLTIANVTSEVWQVVGSVRNLAGYIDPQGRLRLQPSGLVVLLPLSLTAPRVFDITGAVSAASATSLTIGGLTFPVAPGSTIPAVVDLTKLVRITGTLNSANQLTGPVVGGMPTTVAQVRDASSKVTVSGAPTSFLSVGVGLVSDVNAFDGAGPIANSVFIFNPLGTAAGLFLCDESVERVVIEGVGAVFFAPNFTMRQQISAFVNSKFEFQLDQFNWATTGSKRVPLN